GSQNTGAIRDSQTERHDAVVALELAHHDRGDYARVDVASAKNEPDLFPLEAFGLREHGGKAGRASALCHRLLQGEIGIDGAFKLNFVDQDDVRNEIANDWQRQFSDILDCDTFSKRRPPDRPTLIVQGVPDGWTECSFRAYNIDALALGARRNGIAGYKPAAADGKHQNVQVGNVLQHFKCNRSLPGNDTQIVI